jgi:TonB family protein
MKTDCRRLRPLLGPFADGELSAEQNEAVRAHLEACPGCRSELDSIVQLHSLVKKAGPPALHEDYWDWQRTRVWRRIKQDVRERQPFWRPSFVWPRLATLAGGFVVVLVVAVVGWQVARPALTGSKRVRQVETVVERPVLVGKGEAGSPAGGHARSEELAPEPSSGDIVEAPATTDAEKAGLAQSVGGEKVDRAQAERERVAPAAVANEAQTRKSGRSGSSWPMKTAAADEKSVAGKAGAGRIVQGPSLAEPVTKTEAPPTAPVASRDKDELDLEPKQPTLVSMPRLPDVDEKDTGTVLLTFVTDTLGAVKSVKLARSSGRPQLDSIAIKAAWQARFTPAMKGGKRTTGTIQYPLQFRMGKKVQEKQEK